MKDFEEILEEIGSFGRFQKLYYFLVCVPVFFASANSLTYVFTAAVPDYRCLVPDCDDSTQLKYDQPWVEYAVPGSTDKTGFIPQYCNRYIRNSSVAFPGKCIPEMFMEVREKCQEWVFDDKERTIVNDWLITCPENQWKLAFVGTSHFAGVMAGTAIAGILADNFGRKPALLFCILFMGLTGVITALSVNYEMFCAFTFLNAIGKSGIFPLAFVMGVEMVGKEKREFAGIVIEYFYATGAAATGLTAWIFKDWVKIQLITSIPVFIFIVYHWLIPESARWLLAKQDVKRAEIIIKKAARMNGTHLSAKTLTSLSETPLKSDANQDTSQIWQTFIEMIQSRIILGRAFILFYNWVTCAFVFYGLSLNAVNLFGNKYLNFILISLAEIPGYSLSWYFMNKAGRRLTMGLSLIVGGIACMCSYWALEMDWLQITLSMIGKVGITSAFGTIYVYSAEFLPTIIRGGGVGTMSTFARFGAIVAPFVLLLNNISAAIPMMLFGSVAVFGGSMIFFLPETVGITLPETVEEAINIGRRPKTGSMTKL